MVKFQLLKSLSVSFIFAIVACPSFAIAQIEFLNFEKTNESTFVPAPKLNTTKIKQDTSKLNPDNLIHYGDLVDVDVLGSVEYDWRGRVASEGFLSGPNFVEKGVYAACKTVDEVAKQVSTSYARFLNSPKVTVTILDRSGRENATLYGAVRNSLRFKLKRSVRLNELIISAGGFTDKASGKIEIIRQPGASCAARFEIEKPGDVRSNANSQQFVKIGINRGTKVFTLRISDLIKGVISANPEIFYGDIITVKKAEPIYVVGGVENPGKVSFSPEMTVSRAIASAGGVRQKGNNKKITIYRREKSRTTVISVNLDEIATKKVADFILKPFDIIDVTRKGAGKRRYPPVFRFKDRGGVDLTKIPLRIID